tara:strand:- start:82 stop:276 length:195 start_codon:yes stop_codon:yes gene_type:complete
MSSNPFELVDPFIQRGNKTSEKQNKSKNKSDNLIDKFTELIKDKDKETLLEINQILIDKLKKLT